MIEKLLTLDNLLSEFEANKSWDKQYRLIIQLGKKLPVFDDSDKIEEAKVNGCESNAWCIVEKKEGLFYFKMDSDTRVVKGLMMILLIIFNAKNEQQITELDIDEIFLQLGLLKHLSPSRANGLLAIVDKIKMVGSA